MKEMAVLVRAGYHSFDLEIELVRAGIPFLKFGGFKFMESAHIKDLLAFLRVVANPRDTVSWSRVLLLVSGVGRQTVSKFSSQVKRDFDLAAAAKWLRSQKRPPGLKELADLMDNLGAPGQSLMTRMNLALAYYEPLAKARYDDYPKRMKDLEHLLTITARYRELRSFLNDLTLEPPASLADVERAHPRLPHRVHGALGQGPGMGGGLHYLGGGGALPGLLLPGTGRGNGGGTPPHVRGRHQGPELPGGGLSHRGL